MLRAWYFLHTRWAHAPPQTGVNTPMCLKTHHESTLLKKQLPSMVRASYKFPIKMVPKQINNFDDLAFVLS